MPCGFGHTCETQLRWGLRRASMIMRFKKQPSKSGAAMQSSCWKRQKTHVTSMRQILFLHPFISGKWSNFPAARFKWFPQLLPGLTRWLAPRQHQECNEISSSSEEVLWHGGGTCASKSEKLGHLTLATDFRIIKAKCKSATWGRAGRNCQSMPCCFRLIPLLSVQLGLLQQQRNQAPQQDCIKEGLPPNRCLVPRTPGSNSSTGEPCTEPGLSCKWQHRCRLCYQPLTLNFQCKLSFFPLLVRSLTQTHRYRPTCSPSSSNPSTSCHWALTWMELTKLCNHSTVN